MGSCSPRPGATQSQRCNSLNRLQVIHNSGNQCVWICEHIPNRGHPYDNDLYPISPLIRNCPMAILRDAMPVLTRHEGEWAGTYALIDLQGNILDRHRSHLSCQFPTNGTHDYFQINRYFWDDGKQEEHHFPATYREQKIWFDSDRIQGHAWEADHSTLLLYFSYKSQPDFYLYEMIQISPCNNHRARTWHWFKNNQIFQRTLIQEERLS